jgi:hypothetical protein
MMMERPTLLTRVEFLQTDRLLLVIFLERMLLVMAMEAESGIPLMSSSLVIQQSRAQTLVMTTKISGVTGILKTN